MTEAFEALVEQLRASPDRREELRRLVLGDAPDVEGALVRLAGAQERTDAALGRLTERVDRLAERVVALAAAQERTEARLERLTGRVDQLAGQVGELAASMRDLAEQVRVLAARMDAVILRADRAHGYLVERRYAEKGHAYFQRIARRLRRLGPAELDELLGGAGVAEEDAEDLRYADAVFAGRLREQETDGYLLVETSVTIGHEDVTRAHERASVLRNAGLNAIGVVAGEQIAEGVSSAARFLGVWQVTDGTVVAPDDDPLAGAA